MLAMQAMRTCTECIHATLFWRRMAMLMGFSSSTATRREGSTHEGTTEEENSVLPTLCRTFRPVQKKNPAAEEK
jgi:hypothetical protein